MLHCTMQHFWPILETKSQDISTPAVYPFKIIVTKINPNTQFKDKTFNRRKLIQMAEKPNAWLKNAV